MLHVEFIGIPGAGKSTIRSTLLKELKRDNRQRYLGAEEAFLLVARRRIDKVYRVILNFLPDDMGVKFIKRILNRSRMQFEAQNDFLAHYGEALKILFASQEFKTLSYDDRKIVISGFLEIVSIYQAISEDIDDSTVVLFDEGFVQKSMMFISHKEYCYRKNDNALEYLRHIPLPDLTVYIKTNPVSSNKRMMIRSKGLTKRLNKVDCDAVAQFLVNAEAHLEDVVALLNKEGKTTVLEIINDNSLDEIVKKLVTLLPQYMQK